MRVTHFAASQQTEWHFNSHPAIHINKWSKWRKLWHKVGRKRCATNTNRKISVEGK